MVRLSRRLHVGTGIAEYTTASWFCWFSIALVVALLALLWRSFFAGIGRPLLVVAGLYLVVAVGAVALDRYFQSYMMGSFGG